MSDVRRLIPVLLLLAGCHRPPAAGDADAATMAELRALKTAIVEGHRTRNRASLDTLYPDDYRVTDGEGTVRRKAELLAGLDQGDEMVEGRYELGTAQVWGTVAVVPGKGRMVYRTGDSTEVVAYNSVNVFERRDGRWRYVAAFVP